MQTQRSGAGSAHRDNGFVDARDRAYAEGLRRLAGYTSVAMRLTERQRALMTSDEPFEVVDCSHPAMKVKQ